MTSSDPNERRLPAIREIPDRTTVDSFRHPEYTVKFVNLCSRYDPFRLWWTPIPTIQGLPDRSTVDSLRQQSKRPNLSIYVPAMTRSDPDGRPHTWFKISLIEPRKTHLDNRHTWFQDIAEICSGISWRNTGSVSLVIFDYLWYVVRNTGHYWTNINAVRRLARLPWPLCLSLFSVREYSFRYWYNSLFILFFLTGFKISIINFDYYQVN